MLDVSIVITTRNRWADLEFAIRSSLAQTGAQIEVLVFDDASDDGSVERIASRFPEVRLHRNSHREGLIVRRNQGFREARGTYVFSLDDDAFFTSPTSVCQTLELFLQYPDAAAVALPYVEPMEIKNRRLMPPLKTGAQLRSYVGCAHAIHRETALAVGGYRELLIHQGEERDLCIRLLESGWKVVYGNTTPIVHRRSTVREHQRIHHFGYRNTLLFSSLNVPAPEFVTRMAIDSLQLLKYRSASGTFIDRLRGVAAGWKAALAYRQHRSPVQRSTYRKFRRLPMHGPQTVPTGDSLKIVGDDTDAHANGVTLGANRDDFPAPEKTVPPLYSLTPSVE